MAGRSVFKKLIGDPPPRAVFEISEAGLAVARLGKGIEIGFQPLEAGAIVVSPVHDNVLSMEALTAQVQALAPRGEKKRQRAVVILPDFSVRVAVLDFDAFPADAEQRLSLVRFRVKKSLPFEVESAGLSYFVQPDGGGKRVDVVVAVAPMEILARYETPFRGAGFQPGLITTSALCALQMVPATGIGLMAKLSGRVLTLAVTNRGRLKLMRTLEISGGGVPEIASHIHPTFAYMEDQFGARPQQVLTCGFSRLNEDLAREIQQECVPLRSRFGLPDQFNAGLLGYLESLEEYA
jgi:type IV pilus assembly protein PilM